MQTVVVAFLISLVVALAMTPLVRGAAVRFGVLDHAGVRPGSGETIPWRAKTPSLCRDEGKRARDAFDRKYTRQHRTTQFARVLQSLPE